MKNQLSFLSSLGIFLSEFSFSAGPLVTIYLSAVTVTIEYSRPIVEEKKKIVANICNRVEVKLSD